MTRYMLDTNTVSRLVRGNPSVSARIEAVPMSLMCVSAVTAGELLFGLAKRPQAVRLHRVVYEFLRRVDTEPWDEGVADQYGLIRAVLDASGRILAPLDLLIAAHAVALGAVLVTNDAAFGHVGPPLQLADWTR